MGRLHIPKPNKYFWISSISYALMMSALIAFTVFYANSKISPAKTPPAQTSAAASCNISATLVNSCRPWLGAAVGDYPPGSNDNALADEIPGHESRIGRQLDVVHDYRREGQVMSASDVHYATRPNTILMLNWKPAQPWVNGDGGNATVNAQIVNMAKSIKALGSTKILLSIHHEPENDVSSGNCTSNAGKAADGSPAQYVAMWHNVRAIFNQQGVSNVVWVMNYMGFSKWNCLVPLLYPGDSYVDWIMWDPYAPAGGSTINASINVLYSYLTNNSNASHNYLSKTWGLNEWGASYSDPTQTYAAYAMAKSDIDNNTFPKLKLWDTWDNLGFKTDYNGANKVDPAEQAAYNKFADDSHFTNSVSTPSPSPTPTPTPTPTPSPTPTPTPTPTPSPTPSFTACSGPTSSTNLALHHPVEVSSVQTNAQTLVGCRAVDGSTSFASSSADDSRWSSAYSDPQWLTVDLGASKSIGSISINWEDASAKNYQIQTSQDNTNWKTVTTVTGNTPGSTKSDPTSGVRNYTYTNVSARYVRVYGTARSTQYGYSIVELSIQPPGTPAPTPPPVTVKGGSGSGSGVVTIPSPGFPGGGSSSGGSVPQPAGSSNPITIGVAGGGQIEVPANAVPEVKGTISLGNPDANSSDATTSVTVDGKVIDVSKGDAATIDTNYLTNGVHQVVLTTKAPNGVVTTTARNILVNNMLNPFEAIRNPLYVSLGGNKLAANSVAGVTVFEVGVTVAYAAWRIVKYLMLRILRRRTATV